MAVRTRAGLSWPSFDIGANAIVDFIQPGSSAVALNRVNSSNPSQIYGQLNANGQVYLLNPAGVYFAPGANVNVGGLVATTHQMGDADLMNGGSTFERNGANGSVVNDGSIRTGIGGYIALLAPEVRNSGILFARQGTIALAGGEAITLNFGPLSKLESLTVTPSQLATLVENRQAIQAPDGQVILSARAANQLAGSVINSGSIEANGVRQDGGRIVLEASSSISQTGSLSANAAANSTGNGGSVSLIADLSNPNSSTTIIGSLSARAGDLGGHGGSVETSGTQVQIGDATRIDTRAPNGNAGTWLIDPTDFTISSGGAAQTSSGMGASTLQTALGSGNVSITTSAAANGSDLGDIHVNANLS